MTTDIIQKVDTKEDTDISEPKWFKVILINDDYTPIEFVVMILRKVYGKSTDDATRVTMEIHKNGQGIAGVYRFEIAEQKAFETLTIARGEKFPLNVKLEETDSP